MCAALTTRDLTTTSHLHCCVKNYDFVGHKRKNGCEVMEMNDYNIISHLTCHSFLTFTVWFHLASRQLRKRRVHETHFLVKISTAQLPMSLSNHFLLFGFPV